LDGGSLVVTELVIVTPFNGPSLAIVAELGAVCNDIDVL
jgi:hypothetical protein